MKERRTISVEHMWDEIALDMGWHDANMERSRPYNGQPHTNIGQRGATEVHGVTFRDIRDCYIRAVCLSMGASHPSNMPYYEQALRGEKAALCEDDLFQLKGEADPMAVCQNLCCEIERIMGIYPNVPPLNHAEPPCS